MSGNLAGRDGQFRIGCGPGPARPGGDSRSGPAANGGGSEQEIVFRSGALADEEEIRSLLQKCSLPHEDVRDHLPDFVVGHRGGIIVATVGLEILGRGIGLLRSLAVAPEWRGRGLASALCGILVERAVRHGVEDLWLLTTDAEGFFARLGFRAAPREECPPEVRATEEFRSLCPATAVCMHRRIPEGKPQAPGGIDDGRTPTPPRGREGDQRRGGEGDQPGCRGGDRS